MRARSNELVVLMLAGVRDFAAQIWRSLTALAGGRAWFQAPGAYATSFSMAWTASISSSKS